MNLSNIEAIYPLSPFQASLLATDLRALDRSAYCGQMICSLHGPLDTEAFERAWRLIIDRHPILRTMFAWENLEKPVQLVHRQIDFSLLQHDWRGLSLEQQQELLATLLEAERETGFHATQAPLMRLCLCRLSDDDYYLLWSYDLLVLDNWSLPLLLEKAIAVYEGQLKGEIPQVEQGRLYQDYIAWLKQQDITRAEAFWKESLNGLNGSDNLNGLFRSTHETANGYAQFPLPSGLTASLRAFASDHQLDFHALVQGAWALLLSRYSGESEIVYGATVSGRPADLTGASLMIGPFSNVLPVHVRVSSSTPVVSWLKSLSAHLDDLRKYSFYPVTRWSNNNGASHLPAFVSTVQVESSPSNGILHENGASLHVQQIQTVEQTKSPLMLIAPSQSEAPLQLSYNPAAFDDASAARLMQHFENLLTGILQQPQLPISQLSILSVSELDQLLHSFNDTVAPLPQTSIHALFQQQVLQSPDAVALSFHDSSLTYLELDRRSNQLAHHLVSLGVSPDSLVAVCLERSLELFITLLGILKAGAAYLPLDPSYPLARLSFMLADAGSPLLLTTESLADELPTQWTPPVLLDADWDVIALNTDEALPEKVVAAEQLAYVMYTSGSTGTPKGVAVTHGGVLRLVTSPNYVRLDQEQTLLQLAPLTFDASTLEVWGALLNGGRLVVMPPGVPMLAEIGEVIERERVTTLWLTAGLFHLMVDEQLEELSQVEQLLAGGDVLSVPHVEQYLAALEGSERRLINGYGPTENTTFTCCHVMEGQTRLKGSVPIGGPITNTQVYVLDGEMQVTPVGVVGELYIGGAGLARGYYKQPELTAESFVPHPHSTEAGARLYRTGDMVRWQESGELEFIGRVDGQVKVRGFRIEVGEIEAVLAGHEGVREAVVLVREDERGDKRLAAYVVKEVESEATTEELKKYLRERLPEYMQVQWVVAVEELPLTANGKVDRRALQALAVETAVGESVQARTAVEEILAAIWGEVLGRETIGVHDNFFELGGHSLLATQVISRVRDVFGQEVALRSLFEQPTVAGLAREIEAGRGLKAELQAPPLERVERAERLPLSFAQQRLWFLDQLEPGSSFYNIPAAVRLRGVLNVEALERTLSEVVRRHEVLRTHFIAVDGEPVQVIEAAAPFKLELLDLSTLDEAERTAETERLIEEESVRPFDLTTGPLLRVRLFRLGADDHTAIVTMHHIVSDGWSMGIFINEVASLYAAYVRGDESRLEELPIQYADFAHWQRGWLQGEVLAAQLDYWRAELADAPTVIDLPIDKPRPPVQTYRGAHQPLQLSTELSAQLRDFSRRHGSTLFMTLLAAFDLLLCRYAGQEQVLVGSPIANRNRSETEGLIGFFVNTLVLRGDVRGNPSFGELLRRVRETALSAYAHQDLPFEKLVEELQPERDMSRSPLFQVMFVLQNAPSEALELEGLSLSGMESAGDTVKFELTLGLQEVGDVIAGSINYNRDLYEAATIERLVASYERVLQAVVVDAEQRVLEIDLLSAAERRQIIEGWNEIEQEYASALTLSELFEEQAARTPEAVALLFEDTALTYRELNERANQLAWYLQRRGVGPEAPVGVLLERSLEAVITLLAIFKAGGVYVPLEPDYPDERLRFMVRDAELDLVVTQDRLTSRVGDSVVQSIRMDADWPEIANEREDNPPLRASAANLAYIIYTSGSSGTPKGAMVTRGGMLNCLQWMQKRYELTAQDAFLMHTSLNFDPSVWEVFWPLLVGGRVVIAPAGMLESSALLQYMAEQAVTCAYFVPSQLGMLVQERGLSECRSLRYVISGGEKLPLGVMREFQEQSGAELHHSYGPTETAIAATEWTCEAGAEQVLMGRPIGNTQTYVLDGQMEPLPVGVAGELYIGGVGVGRGYVGQAALTAERFVPDRFSAEPGARLYRTGDLVRYDAEGKLEFVGRVDQQVKLRGYRIELGEIEAVLAEHEAVRECTVVAAAGANGETKLLAYLVARQEPTPSVTALREFVQKKLPDYMIPAAFTALDALPLMPNGKVDRRALPAPDAMSLVLGSGFVSPRTPVEEIVASIWSELLGVERIGVVDNFFELGGHSLLATQVIARVRDAFGQEVALRNLFEQPTVAGLAHTIEMTQLAGAGLSAPPLIPIARDVELPLSFAQERLWLLDQLEPGSVAYNIPAAVRLHGVLDVEALERTLSEVVRRHEALRTTFAAVAGEPRQVIKPFTPLVLRVFDVSELAETERETETHRLLGEEAAQPFDLARGPLVRACLVRLGADEHVALVTMHHIVSDGWSTGIFIREVAALYGAYVRGEESPLAELPIQYADFAHWQRGWLQGEVLDAQLAYWREALAEAPALLELPTDRPRPREQTFNGAAVSLVLAEELTGQLKELSQRERVTLFMTLLAAFQSLLFRYSGQDDIVVGTPIANRRYRELEDLIGFFVNTVALRASSLATLTFTELLQRVREVTLGAYAHQDLPFEKLVEELQPERDLSRNPIFQVTFALQNAPSSALELPGLRLEGEGVESRATRFDLECYLWESGPVLAGVFVYNTDLFEQTMIERLVVSFETLLQSIVANPTTAVASLRLLRAEDERQLLYGWNETGIDERLAENYETLLQSIVADGTEAVASPGLLQAEVEQQLLHGRNATETEFPAGVVLELFAQQVARTPERTAVVFEEKTLTFAELNERSNLLASYLRRRSVGAETVVGVMLERSVEMVVAVLGVLKAGGAYLPLDPEYPRERLQFMLADAAVRVLLTQEQLAESISADVELVCLDTEWESIVAQGEAADQPVAVTSDNLAYVIYTSGSTGQPKGVAMPHGPLLNLVQWQMGRSRPAPRTLQFTSLSFDVSFQEIFSTWCAGGTLVLMREAARRDAAALWELLIREGIERLFLPYVALQYLAEVAESSEEYPSTLREVIAAGEQLKITRPIRNLFVKLEDCTLDNHYGPSETHVMNTLRLSGEVAGWPELPSIGRPISNTQVYLLDERQQLVPVGAAGEVYIGGAVLARGYLNRAAATAEKFLPHPFVKEGGARLYRSGDQARYLADGNIEFLGRRDQQVKVRGYRIELGEVEAALREQEQVREAVVISRAGASGEQRLIAYVLTKEERGLSGSVLRGWLRELLPEYMMPAAFVLLEEFPLTPSGKIDRRALQARPVELETGGVSVQARTPAEELVAAIWGEVLGRETIGVHDNFFELGGHSLLATQVISRVRDVFGQEVALRSLFEQPTVAGLAREIEAGRGLKAELQAPPLERVERAERLPLSFAQQRLWFLDQMEPGSVAYNIPAAVRLRGVLNVDALERTLSEVVRRHEVLRTHFIAVDGEPVQVIEAAAPIKLEVLDLSTLDEAERTAETKRLIEEESVRPFDLTIGPLLRVSLLRLDKEQHVALVTMHHIVSDGWSIGVLVREVAALYGAYVRDEESPLAELPIQYADFAHWQRGWLQGEVLNAQLDYWRAELADAPTVIDLPIDKPRPPVQTYRGAYQPLQLSTELSAQLRDLSRRHGSTLFMTLLAAFDLLLCRYAGQEQVLVGSPIANRNRSETEGLIGFFVNTLVLRGDVRGNPSFGELLRRVRETALSAYAYQDLPFEKLVEELQPERDMSRSPLFQVMFVLQNAPGEALELEGLSLSGMESAGDTVKFELTLGLQEVGDVIAGSINYNRDLYEVATIERLVASYERVLQAVVVDAEQRVLEIDLLSAAERQQIIEGWNETEQEYASALTLSELFEEQAARTPEAVALLFEDTALTYRELNERANQLAWYLQRRGVGPEAPVGVLLERSLETIVTLLAIFKAGGVYVPLEPDYPDERLRFMVRDAELDLVVTQERLTSRVGDTVVQSIRVDADWPEIANEREDNAPLLASASNLAYIIYTSGSSGTPKGAMVTRGGMLNCLQWMQKRYELTAQDAFLMHTSLNFDPSVWEVFWPLLVGGRVVVAPAGMLESSALLQYMAEQAVTCAYFVPSQLGMLVQERGLSECHSLRYVISGGEKLPLGVMREFQNRSGAELHHSYGPTETAIAATEWTCEAGAEQVLMGRPIGNTQTYVLDGQMEPLPLGVAGELYIGGVGVGRGYVGQAGLTAERFVPDRFSAEPGARLYRTGDLVRYDAEGKLEFVGRVDQQVKLRGYRIELGEIEAVLRRHEQVSAAAVVLHEADGIKRLVAYVVAEAEAGALREYLKAQLPDYMVPSFFVALDELPLLPNGKLDRRALPAPESLAVAEAEYAAPSTVTEELLAGLWAEVLRVQRVGINDNFFALGGHSLLATQVIARVRDVFGQEVALRSLFEQPTVAGLARTIEIAQRTGAGLSAPALVPIARDVELPLSFAQERLWFMDQLGPGSVAYNIPAAVRLHGVLDVEALERTLSEVVRRHEILRTSFAAVDGEPVQVIAPASQVKLPLLDLSKLPEEQREEEARLLAQAEAGKPFDLSVGPLLRVQLMRFGAEDHVVLFTLHHIITDGWSTGILVNEVSALYEAYTEGRESPLPELEIQYADYAVWQREWLQGEVLEQQLTYWRKQLGEELPVLQLPTDKARPPVQSYRGRSLGFTLPAELTAELKQLSNGEGVTLYMTLLAAFKIVLWRYSGQSDVVVGTPIAGRNHLATEGLIGLFVNTLVLRTSLSGDPTFRELLERVREVTLGAYAHQDLPFEKLVEELQPERDMSRSPLFQVAFALHNETTETLQLAGLEANEVGGAVDETAKFDLTMAVTEIDVNLGGSLQYSTDLFEASTISRILEQFERLLASALRDPERHISELELLSSAERDQLLVERNDTHFAYPHSRGIHELFEEQVALAPEALALTFQGRHLSYAELNSRANQLAHYLRQLGVKTETPVGVCLHRSVEMVVAVIAILKAGGVYIPFDPEYPAERLAFIVEDVFTPVILTDSSLVDDLPSSWAQTVCLDTESELWSGLPTTDLGDSDSSGDNLAYVMYTSGSTGNPKGVAVPHRAVVRLVKQSAYVDFGPNEVFLQLAPVTFDASTLEIWGALLNGGRLVLMPPGAPNLAELGTMLSSEGVTVLWLTAGLFHLMVEHELESLASVRQVVAGGDVLSAEHVRRLLRAKDGSGVVVNGYGPTETTTFACCHRMSGETELEDGVPIGSPIGNTQVYVLGEAMELVGQGMLGELYIGGDGLARGYSNQPGLTAERFVPHPFSTRGGERLYRTGDYVSWRADGTLEFIGRRDTQVKIRGFRVEPGEVEAVLGRHGAVKECAVVVRRETNGEKRLVAYVVDGKHHDDDVNASELRDYLREQLPEFMLPAAIVAIESLPLTSNGKVDRRELAAREVRVGVDQSYAPPRTINEELLCNIWEEVLDAERVGIHDNFFDLGGDSILTIKVIVKTRAVGLELNIQQLFQYQTVHELAQELERSNESPVVVEETAPFSLIGEDDRLRLPAGVVDAYPVTALQAGMLFHTELAPEAGQYHDIFSYHLRMPFDEEALHTALRQLLELHPVLRTSFNLSDFNEPLQLVHEQVEVPLQIEDLRSLTPTEQEEYVAEWLTAEKRHHFDWRKAPLLRFQIVRRDEESFQFSFSFHHAILDGWSLATMLTELFNVYASVRKGDEPRTNAPLSSSFRDFVAAEQAVLNSAEARQYWTGMLSEAPYSRLPRLGQSAGPSRVAGHTVDISGELSLALKALARTAGVPLKSVLLAAHLRALSVLTGSNDVLTGMVSHGRPESADGERVLGLFLNTLPFRRRLAGGTWLQLVQETFAAERELLPFRRYPMARMQQDLGNDTPLFEITFNFVHFHAYEEMQQPGGLEVLGMDGVADTNFTLAVNFSLDLMGSQIGLTLEYDTAELSAEQIEAVGRNYLTILESMTRQPLERYEQQSLLAAAERQRILYDWNDTREAYDLEQCLQQLFEAQ